MRAAVLLALVGSTLATTGFDAIGAISTTQMSCMHSHGHSFYIGRIYHSNGVVDNQGIQDMKNAWSGGLSHVDAYIFPCLSCSAGGAAQVKTAIDNLHNSGVKYGMVWLDIEIYQWKSDKTTNQNFIMAMANELDALKVNWGGTVAKTTGTTSSVMDGLNCLTNHFGGPLIMDKLLGVLLFSFFGATFATTGFDGIGGLTTTQFQCMKTNGHSFYIGRIYRSNGAVDPQGIQDMKNAWAGGLAHVDGYIFPCTNCGTTGASQVTTAINNLKSSGVKYGMVWVDIEVYKWGTDKTANRNFILSMTNQLTSMGITWGVYTNENNWSQIVGNDWTALSNKPLWLGVLLFSFFGATFATTGFDGIGGLTTTQFQCMKTNGHSFYIGRIYRSNGAVDHQGIQDMKNAWAGGLAHVDGYIFPCTNCGTTGASQVTTAINNLKSSGVKYGMVWVDIEVYKWGTDKTANRNFILSMTNQLTSMGITWGVYTNENNWSQIVGNDWTALSNKPLWLGVLLFSFFGATFATTGFDGIGGLTTTQFQCMKTNGHSFYIGRIYRSNGAVDPQGIQDMKNAWAGGLAHVDGYIFPCTNCGTTGASQVTTAINNLKSSGVKYGMVWVDIEVYKWGTDKTANRNFILSMTNQLTSMGITWGVYTNENNWSQIVGNDWTALSNKPLWWARYNNVATLTGGFSAFGGWTKPAIHQYAGDTNGPCGFSVDLNVY